jgi:ATP-dependent DNA helicase RecQ
MSAYTPQTPASLLTISGVGQVKAGRYGETFLALIQEYCQKHNIEEKSRPSPVRRGGEVKGEKSDAGRRQMVVGEAYNAGESVQSLMERYAVTLGTIRDHLVKFAAAGNPLRNGEDLQALTSVSPMLQKAVFDAFDEAGADFLKPAFDRLNGTVSYEDLKILRLLYLIREK